MAQCDICKKEYGTDTCQLEVHASDCQCHRCQRTISPEEEKAIEEFIEAQFEDSLLAEAEELEVL